MQILLTQESESPSSRDETINFHIWSLRCAACHPAIYPGSSESGPSCQKGDEAGNLCFEWLWMLDSPTYKKGHRPEPFVRNFCDLPCFSLIFGPGAGLRQETNARKFGLNCEGETPSSGSRARKTTDLLEPGLFAQRRCLFNRDGLLSAESAGSSSYREGSLWIVWSLGGSVPVPGSAGYSLPNWLRQISKLHMLCRLHLKP